MQVPAKRAVPLLLCLLAAWMLTETDWRGSRRGTVHLL